MKMKDRIKMEAKTQMDSFWVATCERGPDQIVKGRVVKGEWMTRINPKYLR